MRITLPVTLAFTLALVPALTDGAEAEAVAEITDCMRRNIPEPDTIRAVRISSRDRSGAKRDTVIRVYSRRGADGLRQVLVKFLQPEDLKGSSLLMLEREGENEMYLRSKELGTKRITDVSRAMPFLGTDFSYEDFERLLAFRRPGKTRRLEDQKIDGRAAFTLESRPDPAAGSMYERVVTFVDQETCVTLRMDLFEKGRGLRKQLSVEPKMLIQRGRVWLPQLAQMDDLLNYSSTTFLIDSTQQEAALADDLFAVPVLAREP